MFKEAMKHGYVFMQSILLLLVGVAGAGKTSLCILVLSEEPPPIRVSTELAKSSVRTVSFTRAIATQDMVYTELCVLDTCFRFTRNVQTIHCCICVC